MAEVKDKDSKQPEPAKSAEPAKQPEVKETAQYKEFITLNGAVRRDLK